MTAPDRDTLDLSKMRMLRKDIVRSMGSRIGNGVFALAIALIPTVGALVTNRLITDTTSKLLGLLRYTSFGHFCFPIDSMEVG